MTMTSPKTSIFVLASAMAFAPAAALVFLTPGAAADTPQKAAVANVYLGDVSADPAGGQLATLRIEAAARAVCAEVATHSPLFPREQSDCVNATVARAMQQFATERSSAALASAR